MCEEGGADDGKQFPFGAGPARPRPALNDSSCAASGTLLPPTHSRGRTPPLLLGGIRETGGRTGGSQPDADCAPRGPPVQLLKMKAAAAHLEESN